MGNSPSEVKNVLSTVQTNVSSQVNNAIITLAKSNQSYITGAQTVSISDIICDSIKIGPVTQKQVLTYNFANLTNSSNYQHITGAISSGLQNAMNADTTVKSGALRLAQDMGINNSVNTVNNVVNNITSNYTYNDFQNDMQQMTAVQSVGIKGLRSTGTCSIDSISQDQYLQVLGSNITQHVLDFIGKTSSDVKSTQDMTTKNDVTQTGLLQDFFTGISNVIGSVSSYVWLFLFVLLLVIIGLVWGVRYLITPEQELKK